MKKQEDNGHYLEDGAQVGVIGGGPTGAFFSIFALKMAKLYGNKLNITIFDAKDFSASGPIGCNKCGGIISEMLVQMLAVEGINLPDSVVRKGINSYKLHTVRGSVDIATPHLEKTIATVYRGGGPRGMIDAGQESFDDFLLKQAIEEGAVHKPARIDRLEMRNGKPVLFSQNSELLEADLVVGAFGVNSTAAKLFEKQGFGYKEPPTVTAAICEIKMGEKTVAEYFGNTIHLFLLPDKGIKFAALVPKGSYVSLCILGKEMTAKTVDDFLEKPVVKKMMPKTPYSIECRCLPKMNVGAPKIPFTDRIVMCGDAGSTRLYKDGLGAAYLMGKAAAKTAVFYGVSKEDFQEGYYPTYKSIITDNYFGRYLYLITDIYRKNNKMIQGMVGTVRKEQRRSGDFKPLSNMLWDMFTGNERYKEILPKALSPRMHLDLWMELGKAMFTPINKIK